MTCVARVFGRAGLALALLALIGCAPPSGVVVDDTPTDEDDAESTAVDRSAAGADCVVSDNLLADLAFEEIDKGGWAYSQHSGDRSFRVSSEQGELAITRTGVEPWMLLKQKVALPQTNPELIGTWVFSAELKGQVETDPVLHGFEHVAGLLLQPATSPMSAKVAEHEPNQGAWDWQRIEVTAPVLPGHKVVQAGFVHQAGGSLWARNPSLVLMECAGSG